MSAGGADLRSLGADHQMTAVTALPNLDLALLEDSGGLHVVQQSAVSLLVRLLDGGNQTELGGQSVEALLVSGLGKALVHIGPLVVLALGGVEQVLGGIAQLAQRLEPQLGVLLLILCGLQEEGCDLLIAGLLGYGCEVGVLISGLGLACKGLPQVLLGFRACEGVLGGGGGLLDLYELRCGNLANGSLFGSGISFVNITTY